MKIFKKTYFFSFIWPVFLLSHLVQAATNTMTVHPKLVLSIKQHSDKMGHQVAYLFENDKITKTTNSNFLTPGKSEIQFGMFSTASSKETQVVQKMLESTKTDVVKRGSKSSQKGPSSQELNPHDLVIELDGFQIQAAKQRSVILNYVSKNLERLSWKPEDAVSFKKVGGDWKGQNLAGKGGQPPEPRCSSLGNSEQLCTVSGWGYFYSK